MSQFVSMLTCLFFLLLRFFDCYNSDSIIIIIIIIVLIFTQQMFVCGDRQDKDSGCNTGSV